ncbi:hypothetical protein BDR26DRAFT_852172 [Obelidium mucronatum]|nr:hypothetical protein BDR26DRAFT_852172 [Obelidium mucronatum]
MPSAHYLLLTRTSLENAAIAAVSCSLFVGFTLIFQCAHEAASTFVRVFSTVFFTLKVLECSAGPRSGTKNWTPINYIEFLFTSDNDVLRRLRNCEADSAESKLRGIVFPKDRTCGFYLSFAIKLTATYLVYALTRAYFSVYPLEAVRGLIFPWDLKHIVNNLFHAIQLYAILELRYLPMLGLVILLQAPYAPIFNAPYLACSLRDFWSNRWDLVIQKMLHSIAFKPTLAYLAVKRGGEEWIPIDGGHDDGDQVSTLQSASQKAHRLENRIPSAHIAIAVMAAFSLSCLLHEYIVLLFMDSKALGENTLFFMIQGVLCLSQAFLQKITGFGTTWALKGSLAGVSIGWSLTMMTLLVTSPLFLRPYALNGELILPIVPASLIAFLKGMV